MMEHNIIVHYAAEKGYFAAKKEIERLLLSLGDKKPVIDKLKDGFIIGVKTLLDAKEVILELKEKFFANPDEFSATEKWIPVETWSPAGISYMQKELKEMLPQISAGERWSASIESWGRTPSNEEILLMLKSLIKEMFVEDSGSKVVFIEFQGDECAISILRPDDIFVVIPL